MARSFRHRRRRADRRRRPAGRTGDLAPHRSLRSPEPVPAARRRTARARAGARPAPTAPARSGARGARAGRARARRPR
ncbi:hypothetical protein FSW04_15230 [Baekduia soli]|uniref:Uncharacterized protein n=1 Tax=Baekduia soli TaxID=496014 RepID=A0A5B8U6S3_9ACTN|nr:hypothetical protein FSW04_15230 [Baekduia soli]